MGLGGFNTPKHPPRYATDPVHVSSFHFLKIHYNIIVLLHLCLSSSLFPSSLSTKTLYNKTRKYTTEQNSALIAIHQQMYLLIYLLTPWCTVLPEQLTGLQIVKKSPASHGTRRFITALTSVCQLSLSWASPI